MAYNNNWAKTSWPDAATPNGRDLNDWGKSFEVWGWGQTPGTITVNANQNTLANVGPLSFGTSGGVLDGTLAAPGLRFASDQNTGLIRSAADTMQLVVGGSAKATVDATGVSVSGVLSASGGLSISSGGLTVTGALSVTGAITASGVLTATAKGNALGTAGGGGVSVSPTTSDANILLYNFGSGNWSGLGVDGSGNLWFRVGLSGTGVSAFYLQSDKMAVFNGKQRSTATPVYASNAAAISAGESVGTHYRTSTGQLMEVF